MTSSSRSSVAGVAGATVDAGIGDAAAPWTTRARHGPEHAEMGNVGASVPLATLSHDTGPVDRSGGGGGHGGPPDGPGGPPDGGGPNAPIGGGGARLGLASRPEDRRFYLWVAIVTLVHALFVVGFATGAPTRLGAPGGADNAISVEIVTEPPSPQSRSTVSDRAAGGTPPPPPTPARQPASPTNAQRSEPSPPATPPPEPEAAAPPQEPDAQPPAPVETAATAPPATVPALDDADPALSKSAPKSESKSAEPKANPVNPPAAKPELKSTIQPPQQPSPKPETPPKKPQEPRPPPTAKPAQTQPQQRVAKLDLSPPTAPSLSFRAAVGSGAAGVDRPPGITRSGLNDQFALGVIRALQRTMPQLNTPGSVVIEIRLDMNGNLVSSVVLGPSNVAGLDNSVVLSTRQASFPIPFTTAKPDDLIFRIRYIYR